MRAGVLTHESIVRLLRTSFVPLMADTGSSAALKKEARKYGYRGGVPFIAILSPEGKVLRRVFSPNMLLGELRKALRDHAKYAPDGVDAFANADWKGAMKSVEGKTDAASLLRAAAARIHAKRIPAERKLLGKHFFQVQENSSGDLDEAEQYLRKALDQIGSESKIADDILTESARLELVRGKRGAAKEILRMAIEKYPKSDRRGEMYYWLGLIRYADGEAKDALEIWSRGRHSAPDSLWSLRSKLLTIGARKR